VVRIYHHTLKASNEDDPMPWRTWREETARLVAINPALRDDTSTGRNKVGSWDHYNPVRSVKGAGRFSQKLQPLFAQLSAAKELSDALSLRRTGFYLAAAFIAITLNFFIPRMMTGDPVTAMFARFQGRLEPRTIDALRATFGFVEGPLPAQYLTYLQNPPRVISALRLPHSQHP
jgi:hypothetical protein